ncbi:hypothetical protein GCM10009527_015160 [Actinomadura nitritigenes]
MKASTACPPRAAKLRTSPDGLCLDGFPDGDGDGDRLGVGPWSSPAAGRGADVGDPTLVGGPGRVDGLPWMTGPAIGGGADRSDTAPRTTPRTPSQDSATATAVATAHGATYDIARRIDTWWHTVPAWRVFWLSRTTRTSVPP